MCRETVVWSAYLIYVLLERSTIPYFGNQIFWCVFKNRQNMEWFGTNDYLSSARLCSKAFQMPLLCLMEVLIHLQSGFLKENIWIARKWLISLLLIEFCFWQPLAGQVERTRRPNQIWERKRLNKVFLPNICSWLALDSLLGAVMLPAIEAAECEKPEEGSDEDEPEHH